MSHAEQAVTMRDVTFSYGGAPVLEDVSFTIGPREAVSLIGPNGGGKTTLVKLMLGMLSPRRGEVRLFGRPPWQSRRRVGYMPQQMRFDPCFPVCVADVVLMGRLGRGGLTGWPRHADHAAARDALALVGLRGFWRQPFSSLSGGQRQRVLIARALACQGDLLVLDEPTANVDSSVEVQLLELLRQLNQRMAIILVSHDLGFVSELVERVVCVNRRVAVHPTAQLTGLSIQNLYGGEVRAVRHHEVVHDIKSPLPLGEG
jgi:zinc transport system ATP-binding protein